MLRTRYDFRCPGASYDADHPKDVIPMLVLSRKRNESIVIGDDVVVRVIEVRGDKVRLGIEAPREISVHRKEVFDAIHNRDGVDAPPQA